MNDRLATGERLPAAAKAMGIASEFRAQTLAGPGPRVGRWRSSTPRSTGVLELDAMVKGAPDTGQDAAQRRLAFTLWVIDHVGRVAGAG